MTRAKADELFRHMLRHLEVAFLRRWFMWGAVRLTSIFRDPPGPPRRRQLGLVLLLLLAALPVAIAPVVAIMAGLLVFFALEWLTYPVLAAGPPPARAAGEGEPARLELAHLGGSSPDP